MSPEFTHGPVLSVVIPVFNEEDNIQPLVQELDAVVPTLPCSTEVIIVDDGSRDQSWTRISQEAAGRSWLRALRFRGNQGQTAAMAAGIAAARGELVGFLDADLQNDPRDLTTMLHPLLKGEADVVCGWRVRRHDGSARVLVSRVANFILTRLLDLRLHDLGCTLKIFRRAFVEDTQLYGEMHRFIAAYAKAQGARILEVPVNHRPRERGVSKYGFNRVYKVLIDLLTVTLLNTYGAKPAYLFGKIGLAFFILGWVLFAQVAYRALVLDRVQSTPMIFIMMLFFITSVICFMSGLLAELNIRILHKVGGLLPYKIVDRVGEHGPGEQR
ncbi:MAG: glycosyltransferase [Myxococcota bacterium]